MIYECVTGKDRLDFPELPADWRTRPDFDELLEFNEILTKACDGDPGQRYASAKAMLADLTILEVGESIKRRRTLQQRWAVCKKAGIAVVLVALATAAALFFVRDRRDGDLLSADPKVNALVEQGNVCILSETPERVSQALKYFKEAVELDPKFAPAWFGLFQAYISHHGQAPGDWEMNLRATAQHLMEIDPSSAESHFASALIKWIDWQFRAALVEARAATTARAGDRVPAFSEEEHPTSNIQHPTWCRSEWSLAIGVRAAVVRSSCSIARVINISSFIRYAGGSGWGSRFYTSNPWLPEVRRVRSPARAIAHRFPTRGGFLQNIFCPWSVGSRLASNPHSQLVGDSRPWHGARMEIVLSVTQEADGGFVAECLSHDIFTQGNTWEELRRNVREAVTGYFFDQPKPTAIRLHLVRDEVLTCA